MNVLFPAAVLLALVAAQSWLSRRFSFRRLEYGRKFSKNTVTAGETLEMIETIRNRKLLPLPFLCVETKGSPWLHFKARRELDISARMYHRSVFSLGPYREIVRRHPLTALKRGDFDMRVADRV